jgi:hypothetical protein
VSTFSQPVNGMSKHPEPFHPQGIPLQLYKAQTKGGMAQSGQLATSGCVLTFKKPFTLRIDPF